jgi:hypothetical protein
MGLAKAYAISFYALFLINLFEKQDFNSYEKEK